MRTFKIFFSTIRSMSFKKILRLLRLVLPHPVFSLLSFYATLKAYTIAQKKFPETASTNGIGNAFRHALWCCFIMMYCCKVSSPKKALEFCKRITDLHEELFPNKPLETKMDLHNNKIGMDYFMEMLKGVHRQFFEKSFFIDGLEKKMQDAKVLKNTDDDFKGFLVYLDEK
ncbi:hypothetical protein QE422_000501 [Chryseobacterium sp. SORGH_AS 447]|uniref:DUF6973 domain-containing protein n=1 Tax=Chryseobacterium sp. SORGH_AS_0447 TaxID=3041769 RepID=UPI00277F60B9|nr:hypothetical protein [Chryseobacterium sp. SORGH_AS_0447]MDQ1160133.1 hypothetical protein [Chryseobacterium sp. SORGH_AS_0447]